ncbi:MAG: hypothetical protein JW841_00140 [Deltaproteobacteria bacterium]|nr:hypothetical protein [Deltaproteobacteria bacterium]
MDWINSNVTMPKKRRICFGAAMAHEFSHACWGNETRAENIEDLTREFLNDYFGYNLTNVDCNSD